MKTVVCYGCGLVMNFNALVPEKLACPVCGEKLRIAEQPKEEQPKGKK